MYRQGDLLFVPVASTSWPQLSGEPEFRKKVTVAEGELTGHKHELHCGQGGSLLADDDLEFFRIMGANGLLTHPEHGEIELPAGDYRLVKQMEFSEDSAPRYVLD